MIPLIPLHDINPFATGMQQGADIYSQMLQNRNLPDKLREALLAQRLQNQQQQITNQYLPQEKQLGVQHQQMINQYYPKLQESLLGQRGLGNEMTRMQMEAMRQSMLPGGSQDIEKQTALAKLAMLQQQTSPEYLQQQRADEQTARKYKESLASGAEQRAKILRGEAPSIAEQNAINKQRRAISGITQLAPSIIEGMQNYMGAEAPSYFVDSIKDTFGLLNKENQDKLYGYRLADQSALLAGEELMGSGALPRVKEVAREMKEIFKPRYEKGILKESKESYTKRVVGQINALVKKYGHLTSIKQEGLPNELTSLDEKSFGRQEQQDQDEFAVFGGRSQ